MILKYRGKENYAPKSPVALHGAGVVLGRPSIEDFLCIRVDTREQLPIDFDSEYVKAGRGTVPVFDYALEGDQDNFAIERKSVADLVQAVALSISWKRELNKIAKAQARLLPIIYICEGTEKDVREYDYSVFKSGRVNAPFICRRLGEMVYDYGVLIWWAGSRQAASYWLCVFLKRRLESLRAKQ